MSIHRTADPWSGATYNGFSNAPAGRSQPPPALLRQGPPRRVLLIGGVAAALMLGVGFGFWARPELGSKARPAPAAPAPAPAAPSAGQMPIAVVPRPAPEPLPRAPGRLQTLPPDMAAAARAQAQARLPARPSASSAPSAAAASQPTTPDLGYVPPAAREAAPAAGARASFDCATAEPGAEQMVCADPALASADRQMAQAYRRALSAGAAPGDLRQDQRDWAAIREDAARHSPRALAQVYDQRIEELNRIAEDAPGGE
jgi:uncharacterized protein YecT (DUF1311 family)